MHEASSMDSNLSVKDKDFKLATFLKDKKESVVGVVCNDAIWPLQDVLTLPPGFDPSQVKEMVGLIRYWDILESRIMLRGNGIQLSSVKLQAPIPLPTGAIMCIGKNYADHVKELDTWKTAPGIAAANVPKHPIVFTKAPQSVIGHRDAIRYPHGVSSQVDYEAELAVITGKSCRNVKKEAAMSYVFGYTILNDVTARDLQKRHQQWFLGKSCDTFCPMGPYIVPASKLNGQDVQIKCWINGELRQNGRTSDMLFSIPELIETISAGITLQPGDIIATGTPSGVGSGFNPPKHLLAGDIVRIEIEGIGVLENNVE